MQGDTGGGNEESVWIYCYAITKIVLNIRNRYSQAVPSRTIWRDL